MNQITIRGLDDELSACLRRLAKREGLSLNQAALRLLRRGAALAEGLGRDADIIVFGSTLSIDRHAAMTFDYLIAYPPYSKDWKRDERSVRDEHARGAAGRFGPGLPRALEEIDRDIREIEEEIVRILGEVTASTSAQ